MKRLVALVICLSMFTGCALLTKVCQNQDKYWEYKGKLGAYLKIAQVNYPLVVNAAVAVKPNIMDPAKVDAGVAKVVTMVGIVDAALDVLGRLFFDVACPTEEDVKLAAKTLAEANSAKVQLGIQ